MENKDKVLQLARIFADLVADEGFMVGEVLNCHQILVIGILEQVEPKERRHRILMEFIRNLIQISLEKHVEEIANQEK